MGRVSDTILGHVFNSSQFSLIVVGRDRVIRLFNDRAAEWIRMFTSREMMPGFLFSDFISYDDHPEFEHAFNDFDAGRIPSPVVNIVRSGDDERWYETVFSGLGDGNELILLSISDITARKLTFDRLSESERRFKALMLHSPGITAVIDSEGGITFVSESVSAFLGYPAAECRGRSIFDFVHGIDRRKFTLLLRGLQHDGRHDIAAEIQFVSQSGQTLYFDINGTNQLENPVVGGIILNMHDITERKYMDEMVRRVARYNALILQTASEGIFGVGTNGNITFVNPFAASILGFEERDLVGRSYTVFSGESSPLADVMIAADSAHAIETEFVMKSGARFPVEFSAMPITESGESSGYVITFKDISRRKANEAEILAAKNEAESANRAKSDFLATMSHEIRTPMNSILGFLELMRMGNLDAPQREYLAIAESNARNLIEIINEILDMSKIEKGKLELDSVPFDPVERCALTMRLFEARAEMKNLTLSFEHDELPPCTGDPLRLGQVLTNLIGNAVKFTPDDGRVILSVRARESGDDVEMDFSVSDTGIGIPADKITSIFDSFTQGDTSIMRRFGGTGLGLTISSHIVGLMGGRISVESEPGKGSRFFFTIKLPRAKRSEVNRNRMMPDRPLDVFNKHALLAEDTADSRKLISLMIAKLGITSDLAENGKMALEMYRNGDYDLVLMDGNMPEMDGAEATRAIRRFEREAGRVATPIIALSAKIFADDRDAFIEAGADDFVVKPVSIRAMSTAIRKIFRHEELDVAENEEEEPSAGDGYIQFISRKMGLPYKITEDLLREFVASFPTYIDDILSSVESGDVKRIEHAAHRLKGVAASYELEPLSAKCALLEECARRGETGKMGTLPSEIYAEAEKVRTKLDALLVAK